MVVLDWFLIFDIIGILFIVIVGSWQRLLQGYSFTAHTNSYEVEVKEAFFVCVS